MHGLFIFPVAIIAAVAAALTTMALASIKPSLTPMLLYPLAFVAWFAVTWAALLAFLV